MKVIAKFKGKNGSLGYVNGRTYMLTIREQPNGSIWITRKEEYGGSCEYSNIIKFFENWTDINTDYD